MRPDSDGDFHILLNTSPALIPWFPPFFICLPIFRGHLVQMGILLAAQHGEVTRLGLEYIPGEEGSRSMHPGRLAHMSTNDAVGRPPSCRQSSQQVAGERVGQLEHSMGND